MSEVTYTAMQGWRGYLVDSMKGSASSAIDELKNLLESQNVVLTHGGRKLSQNQVSSLLAHVLPDDGADNALQDVETIARVLNSYAGQELEVRDFHASAQMVRLDEEVLNTIRDIIDLKGGVKDQRRDELKRLAAELKIFGVVQSMVNTALAGKQNIFIGSRDASVGGASIDHNLLEGKLYGYSDETKFKEGPEYAFLTSLNTYSNAKANGFSIKDFLSGTPKESGGMLNLQDEYKFEKDNNPISNFSMAIGDRSRPLSDKVNEVSTIINEVNSRYNSVIEALNRVMEKFDKILKSTLSQL